MNLRVIIAGTVGAMVRTATAVTGVAVCGAQQDQAVNGIGPTDSDQHHRPDHLVDLDVDPPFPNRERFLAARMRTDDAVTAAYLPGALHNPGPRLGCRRPPSPSTPESKA